MSGGHFDYRQYHIVDIADAIQEEIDRNEMGLSDETLREFMLGVSLLRRSAIYVQRIDWLLSGDDAEDTFHHRLREELCELFDEQNGEM